MTDARAHRTLIVANRTAATPLLVAEVARRARERPTQFALLIPNPEHRQAADWTLENAVPLLERAARAPVEGLVGGADAYESVRDVLAAGDFDDVLISTLHRRFSEWLRRDLPHRVEALGVPVQVITAVESHEEIRGEIKPLAGPLT